MNKKKKKLPILWSHLCLIIGTLFMIIPFVWMLSTSLKESGNVFVYPPQWFPRPLVWENYARVLKQIDFARYLLNTAFITICVVSGQLLTSSLGAYAFARLKFPGRDRLFLLYLGTMMIPGQVTMIPIFIFVRIIGWIDTYAALIIPSCFTAWGTFLLRQFFLTIPKELEDAAAIDGCSAFGKYWRIILPLSKPALATLGVFAFMGTWNSFQWPLIVTISEKMRTLSVALATFQGVYRTDWTLLMAGSVLTLLPILLVFIFGQKYFVEGITLTGLKG
jgi:multiple sugar transport system permease protein